MISFGSKLRINMSSKGGANICSVIEKRRANSQNKIDRYKKRIKGSSK